MRTPSMSSGLVDRLHARGLVTREVDPSDRRYTRVQVTEPVQNYTREISEGPYARLTCVPAEASPAERKTVLDGLETLRALPAR